MGDSVKYVHIHDVIAQANARASTCPVGAPVVVGFGPLQDDELEKTPALLLYFNDLPGEDTWRDQRVPFENGANVMSVIGKPRMDQWDLRFSAELLWFSMATSQQKDESRRKASAAEEWLIETIKLAFPPSGGDAAPIGLFIEKKSHVSGGGPPDMYIERIHVWWSLRVFLGG